MNKKIAAVLIIIGIISIVLGMAVLIHNDSEEKYAEAEVEKVLPRLKEEIFYEDNNILSKEYVGYLVIKKLKLELPVLSQLSSYNLKKSPCVYAGYRTENFVIAAHNYKSHFGKIDRLDEGDVVEFVDINNEKHKYNVCAKEVIGGDEAKEMLKDSYKLTLFTCDYTGKNRIVVRCN